IASISSDLFIRTVPPIGKYNPVHGWLQFWWIKTLSVDLTLLCGPLYSSLKNSVSSEPVDVRDTTRLTQVSTSVAAQVQ
ncbi:MAG: hypothetical protein KDI67_10450, partial [Gammaproteobacteria bacterium]|nr:hypothetical protein [Gammaproteobacteria bacterium]